MVENVWGLVAVIVFYLIILVIGLVAGRKQLKKSYKSNVAETMLAGRDIPLYAGIFTMTATWVGGGYINGTAEVVYLAVKNDGMGLLWAQAPIGFSCSLLIAGLFFAKKMRKAEYMTMIDPFQNRLGDWMGALLVLPAVAGETIWSGAILAALGSTLTVIIGLEMWVSVLISAAIALLYVMIGGLASVVYTDIVQLLCIAAGLITAAPFAVNHPAVGDIFATGNGTSTVGWLGYIESKSWGTFIDSYLLLIFGGIPWQVYFQRILACRTPKQAQILSFCGGVGCLFFCLPSIFIGAAAYATDWNQTAYADRLAAQGGELDARFVLPLVLQYLTPPVVAVIGLGAVAAAVMSSADSSMLSSSSMFTNNVYKIVIRPNAGQRELIWVMRISALFLCAVSTAMAITVQSIYGLFVLCGDFVYVLLFPQLVCVMYMPSFNTFGSFAGFVVTLILRLIGGETYLNWKAPVAYPWYDEATNIQYFPYKTFSMLMGFLVMVLVSLITTWMMESGKLDRKWLGKVNNRLDKDGYEQPGAQKQIEEDENNGGVELESKRYLNDDDKIET